jgi:hypothetical protein
MLRVLDIRVLRALANKVPVYKWWLAEDLKRRVHITFAHRLPIVDTFPKHYGSHQRSP